MCRDRSGFAADLRKSFGWWCFFFGGGGFFGGGSFFGGGVFFGGVMRDIGSHRWWCDVMELDTEVKLMPPAIEAFMVQLCGAIPCHIPPSLLS